MQTSSPTSSASTPTPTSTPSPCSRSQSQKTRRSLTLPATRRGYRQALRLARRQAPGRRAWALEGTGSYGAGLARFLHARGEQVLEVERPRRQGRRGRLKSDALDAERAARSLLSGQTGALPRLDPETQALRALLVAREGAVVAAHGRAQRAQGAPPERARRASGAPAATAPEGTARGLRPPASRRRLGEGRPGAGPALARPPGAAAAFGGHPARARAQPPPAHPRPGAAGRARGGTRSRRRRCCSPGRRPGGCARRPPSPAWPAWPRSPPARARSSAIASTVEAIAA